MKLRPSPQKFLRKGYLFFIDGFLYIVPLISLHHHIYKENMPLYKENMPRFWPLLLCALLLPLAACDSSSGPEPPEIEETAFADSLGVDLAAMTETPSGLYVRDLEVGSGEAIEAGEQASVHYTGWLPDGTRFDARGPEKPPITFPLRPGGVIRGWVEGLPGMRVGGTRQLVIPPSLAYGGIEQGAGKIPPYSILVFEVTLVEIPLPPPATSGHTLSGETF